MPFPNGHFYSPVVDAEELRARRAELWPEAPQALGIDFNDESHRAILHSVFPRHIGGYDYPEHLEESKDLDCFYTRNSQFSWLDSRALFVLLSEWRPQRVIEVGSGFSSLLMADVNVRSGNAMEITCVEPYPRAFLAKKIPGISRLIQKKVQEVPLAEFAALQSGDVLFIDSSHVAKTGSDVNYLFFEVLPRLTPGVFIHIHDIFLPYEYPEDWVLAENRSWNEQYLVRALLMYSHGFKVVFGCSYAFGRFREDVRAALALPKGHAFGGGSLWLQKQ